MRHDTRRLRLLSTHIWGHILSPWQPLTEGRLFGYLSLDIANTFNWIHGTLYREKEIRGEIWWHKSLQIDQRNTDCFWDVQKRHWQTSWRGKTTHSCLQRDEKHLNKRLHCKSALSFKTTINYFYPDLNAFKHYLLLNGITLLHHKHGNLYYWTGNCFIIYSCEEYIDVQ